MFKHVIQTHSETATFAIKAACPGNGWLINIEKEKTHIEEKPNKCCNAKSDSRGGCEFITFTSPNNSIATQSSNL